MGCGWRDHRPHGGVNDLCASRRSRLAWDGVLIPVGPKLPVDLIPASQTLGEGEASRAMVCGRCQRAPLGSRE